MADAKPVGAGATEDQKAAEVAAEKAATEQASDDKAAAEKAEADKAEAAAKPAATPAKAEADKPESKKGHVVIGAAVVLATEDGSERYLYRGAPVGDGFTKDSIKHAISVGLIAKAK